MFKVIERPNDFIKTSKSANAGDKKEYRRNTERKEFWVKLNEILVERGKPFNLRKPTTDHWYDIAIGTSEAHIAINLVNKDNIIVVELYIQNNKALFDQLFASKSEIEDELKMEFVWDRLDGKKASRIKHQIEGLNFDDHSNYRELINEVIDKAVKMRTVFKKYI